MNRGRVKTILQIWITLSIAAIVLGYGAFRAFALVQGPEVAIASPADGAVIHDSLVDIRGTADNIAYLRLNGNMIFTDQSGAWDQKVVLSPGYNVVTLEAKDRFGRIERKTLQLTYN